MRLNAPFTRRPLLNRKKNDPTKFVFTGEGKDEGISSQRFTYNAENITEESSVDLVAVGSLDHPTEVSWLNVYGLSQTEIIASVCEKQGIHSLAIQDILDIHQRPKFQEYENFSFLTLKSLVVNENKVVTEQVSLVFTKAYLISFQEQKADLFDHLRFRLREKTGVLRERSADYLVYAVLESILDNYFKTLDKIEHDIEQLHLFDTQKDPSPEVLASIESYKKLTHYIKKSILPIKEFTLVVDRGKANFIERSHIKYFQEIKDLCLSLVDQCEMINASLESATNLFFSVQGHRMNQVIKILTIVSTIFIPLTFIVGIYGMNFTHMPELEWRYGYLFIMLLNFAIFGGMLLYFKRKKWF
jgi:magnesium transporter